MVQQSIRCSRKLRPGVNKELNMLILRSSVECLNVELLHWRPRWKISHIFTVNRAVSCLGNNRNLNLTTSHKLNSGDIQLLFPAKGGKGLVREETLPPRGQAATALRRLIKKSLGKGGGGGRRLGSPLIFSPSPSSETLSDSNRSLNSFLSSFFSWTFLRLISGRSRSSIFIREQNASNGSILEKLQSTKQSQYSLQPQKKNLTGDSEGLEGQLPFLFQRSPAGSPSPSASSTGCSTWREESPPAGPSSPRTPEGHS